MKKGEMSMAMIIGAVIAIIILAISVFLIARGSGDTNKATACPAKGGVCTSVSDGCSKSIIDKDGTPIPCPNMGEICCSITSLG